MICIYDVDVLLLEFKPYIASCYKKKREFNSH